MTTEEIRALLANPEAWREIAARFGAAWPCCNPAVVAYCDERARHIVGILQANAEADAVLLHEREAAVRELERVANAAATLLVGTCPAVQRAADAGLARDGHLAAIREMALALMDATRTLRALYPEAK